MQIKLSISQPPEIPPHVDVSLVGRETISFRSLRVVAQHTMAIGVQEPQIELGVDISADKPMPRRSGTITVWSFTNTAASGAHISPVSPKPCNYFDHGTYCESL